MAECAISTPAPEDEAWYYNPTNPLPPSASMAWVELWQSVCRLHRNSNAAVVHAYEAGVDPEQFCGIQIAGWSTDPEQDYPIISLGDHPNGPCRRFGPGGEVDPIAGAAQ